MIYATLAEVKEHLRYEPSDTSNDATLSAYLAAAEQAITQYITDTVTGDMKQSLKVATLLLCGYFDIDRNAEQDRPELVTMSGLPYSVQLLLTPYRKPTAV